MIKRIPITFAAETARIVLKSDEENFQWFRKNYLTAGALPTLQYYLHQRAGKLNDSDLQKEREYFAQKATESESCFDTTQKKFQELKSKTDTESKEKLVELVGLLTDCAESANRAREAVGVYEKAIAENEKAIETIRRQKVGAKFKAARLQHKLTQEQVGDYVGVHKMRVSDYEAGKTEPPIKTLLKIVKLFNLSLDELYDVHKKNTDC